MAQTDRETGFLKAWADCWEKLDALGIPTARMRKQARELGAVPAAKRMLKGHRCSDGFPELTKAGKLQWSLEALVVKAAWGSLFTDEEANEALNRLMEAGYGFHK